MPYFVYHISIAATGKKNLTHLQTFPDYKPARALARERRAALASGGTEDVRMIFAKNPVEAEKLLSAPRDERVVGED